MATNTIFTKPRITNYLNTPTSIAPLVIFRICFGLLMLISMIRFWANGWIDAFYIQPHFFFSYYGFEWVKPLGVYTYLLFIVCGLSCIGIIIGYRYRWSMLLFFLSFGYIELMDKTTYLNHYYFVTVLSFLLLLLPAHRYFSWDSYRDNNAMKQVPQWCVYSIKLLLSIVYIYAGLAKINSEWLFDASPLNIWLSSKQNIPIIGSILSETWVHYAFSWGGTLYDLSIPFLLWSARTRWVGFVLVVIFHALTKILFPIGMFPYIMIVSALIFFCPQWHERILAYLKKMMDIKIVSLQKEYKLSKKQSVIIPYILILFFGLQILLPWRYMLYPDELFWTEEGYRFSWRVMLMEKAGYTQFKVTDAATQQSFYVDNSKFLNSFQEKQMAMQPDFILEYAHFLGDYYAKTKNIDDIEIRVESFVALNGRPSRPYINPNINLLDYQESFAHKTFILPFDDEIKGF